MEASGISFHKIGKFNEFLKSTLIMGNVTYRQGKAMRMFQIWAVYFLFAPFAEFAQKWNRKKNSFKFNSQYETPTVPKFIFFAGVKINSRAHK